MSSVTVFLEKIKEEEKKMAFKIGDTVKWKRNQDGSLPDYAEELGDGPFKVVSVRGMAVCTCGRSEAFNRAMSNGRLDPENDFDEIDFHDDDCELWHMGEKNYPFSDQHLTIATGKGPKEFGTCWLQEASCQ